MKVISHYINRKAGHIILETSNGFFRISKSGKVEKRCDRNVRINEAKTDADGYYESPCGSGRHGIPGTMIAKCYRILGV